MEGLKAQLDPRRTDRGIGCLRRIGAKHQGDFGEKPSGVLFRSFPRIAGSLLKMRSNVFDGSGE